MVHLLGSVPDFVSTRQYVPYMSLLSSAAILKVEETPTHLVV